MKRLEWDAGHRLIGHEGKCRHLHGHRYAAEISVTSDSLDGVGRVIDFSVIKEKIGKWIDDNLDHNMMLCADDPLAHGRLREEVFGDLEGSGKEPFIMPGGHNPTAECIAELLASVCKRELKPYGLTVVSVRVYETPTCSAQIGWS